MRKYISLCTLCFLVLNCYSQISVGSKEWVKLRPGKIEEKNLALLKNSKTYFVCRKSDEGNIEQLESALKEAWTISELHVISYDEYNTRNFDSNSSFITINASHTIMDMHNAFIINLHVWMFIDGKKEVFGSVALFPAIKDHYESTSFVYKHHYDKDSDKGYTKDMMPYAYNEATFYNWQTLYLKNAFQCINNKLENNEYRYLYKDIETSDVALLAKDTLFVTDEVLIKLQPYKKRDDERHNPNKLFKSYDYLFQVISHDKLLEKIVARGDKPLFYMSYLRSNSDKFISVINSTTGEYVYNDYRPMEVNVDTKDIKYLNKAITKNAN